MQATTQRTAGAKQEPSALPTHQRTGLAQAPDQQVQGSRRQDQQPRLHSVSTSATQTDLEPEEGSHGTEGWQGQGQGQGQGQVATGSGRNAGRGPGNSPVQKSTWSARHDSPLSKTPLGPGGVGSGIGGGGSASGGRGGWGDGMAHYLSPQLVNPLAKPGYIVQTSQTPQPAVASNAAASGSHLQGPAHPAAAAEAAAAAGRPVAEISASALDADGSVVLGGQRYMVVWAPPGASLGPDGSNALLVPMPMPNSSQAPPPLAAIGPGSLQEQQAAAAGLYGVSGAASGAALGSGVLGGVGLAPGVQPMLGNAARTFAASPAQAPTSFTAPVLPQATQPPLPHGSSSSTSGGGFGTGTSAPAVPLLHQLPDLPPPPPGSHAFTGPIMAGSLSHLAAGSLSARAARQLIAAYSPGSASAALEAVGRRAWEEQALPPSPLRTAAAARAAAGAVAATPPTHTTATIRAGGSAGMTLGQRAPHQAALSAAQAQQATAPPSTSVVSGRAGVAADATADAAAFSGRSDPQGAEGTAAGTPAHTDAAVAAAQARSARRSLWAQLPPPGSASKLHRPRLYGGSTHANLGAHSQAPPGGGGLGVGRGLGLSGGVGGSARGSPMARAAAAVGSTALSRRQAQEAEVEKGRRAQELVQDVVAPLSSAVQRSMQLSRRARAAHADEQHHHEQQQQQKQLGLHSTWGSASRDNTGLRAESGQLLGGSYSSYHHPSLPHSRSGNLVYSTQHSDFHQQDHGALNSGALQIGALHSGALTSGALNSGSSGWVQTKPSQTLQGGDSTVLGISGQGSLQSAGTMGRQQSGGSAGQGGRQAAYWLQRSVASEDSQQQQQLERQQQQQQGLERQGYYGEEPGEGTAAGADAGEGVEREARAYAAGLSTRARQGDMQAVEELAHLIRQGAPGIPAQPQMARGLLQFAAAAGACKGDKESMRLEARMHAYVEALPEGQDVGWGYLCL